MPVSALLNSFRITCDDFLDNHRAEVNWFVKTIGYALHNGENAFSYKVLIKKVFKLKLFLVSYGVFFQHRFSAKRKLAFMNETNRISLVCSHVRDFRMFAESS